MQQLYVSFEHYNLLIPYLFIDKIEGKYKITPLTCYNEMRIEAETDDMMLLQNICFDLGIPTS